MEEVDRGGSFASHMSKCITLLMQVLKESNDSDMLMELGLQLSKRPDVDKYDDLCLFMDIIYF